jgi:3-phenylpropionate/trans-cinnamate dioxygenase ferredoxin subunit
MGGRNRVKWKTSGSEHLERSIMAFVKAGKVSEVPPGRVKVVEIGDEDVALCNVSGEILAVANVCTHDQGPLGEGYLLGDEIECPRHGARFNVRTGAVKTLPAIIPIPTFEVRIEGDDILVDVD